MVGTFISYEIVGIAVLAAFLTATIAEYHNKTLSRYLAAAAWALFGLFWLNLIEFFAFVHLSAIEGVLSALAVPGCLFLAYSIYTDDGEYFLITRAITVMGLIYFPVVALPAATQLLIETVASHVHVILNFLGYYPEMVIDDNGYKSTFLFVTNDHQYLTRVVLACSGLGSISIMTGLIASVRASPREKLLAISVVVPVIWILNLGRVTFITLAHGHQWFRIGVDAFAFVGITDVHTISYLVADRIIAQSLSLVALVVLTLLLIRLLPGVAAVLNEVIEPLTGQRYDFGHTSNN